MLSNGFLWGLLNAFELNNRELAGLIWLGIVAVGVLSISELRPLWLEILKMALQPKLLLLWIVYPVWIFLFIVVAVKIEILNFILLKDTLFWCATAGFVLYVRSIDAKDLGQFWNNLLNASVFLLVFETVANLSIFSLIVEILLQPILFFVFAAQAISEHHKQYKDVKKISDWILYMIFIAIVGNMIRTIYLELQSGDLLFTILQAVWPALLGVWILIVTIPVVIAMSYVDAFRQLSRYRRKQDGLWKAKLGLILALRCRLRLISEAQKGGTKHIANAESVADAYEAAQNFKKEAAAAKQQEAADRGN